MPLRAICRIWLIISVADIKIGASVIDSERLREAYALAAEAHQAGGIRCVCFPRNLDDPRSVACIGDVDVATEVNPSRGGKSEGIGPRAHRRFGQCRVEADHHGCVGVRHYEVAESVKDQVAGINQVLGVCGIPLRQRTPDEGSVSICAALLLATYRVELVRSVRVKGQALRLVEAGVQHHLGGAAQRNLRRGPQSGQEQIEDRFGLARRRK